MLAFRLGTEPQCNLARKAHKGYELKLKIHNIAISQDYLQNFDARI